MTNQRDDRVARGASRVPAIADLLAGQGIETLSLPTPFPVGQVNVYLIRDEPLTLIDSGTGTTPCLDLLERCLADRCLALEQIEMVLLTHHHPDHCGLASTIARRSGAEIVAPRPLAGLLKDYDEHADAEVATMSALMLRHGVPAAAVEAMRRPSRLAFGFACSATVDRILDADETVHLRDRTLRAAPRPGHSATDTVYFDGSSGILFGGDHLLAQISSNAVIGAGGDGSRTRALVEQRCSLCSTRDMEPRLVLGGHGEPVTDPCALVSTRLRQQELRAERILGLIRAGPASAYELSSRLLGSVALGEPFLAISEVLGHLDLLLDDGVVIEERGPQVARFLAR